MREVFSLYIILHLIAVQAYNNATSPLSTLRRQGETGSTALHVLLDYLLPEEGWQCVKGPTWRFFCNDCVCLGGQLYICSWRNCGDLTLNKNIIKPHRRQRNNNKVANNDMKLKQMTLSMETHCVEGEDIQSFDTCNRCYCGAGKILCTNKKCSDSTPPRCTPGSILPSPDNCNSCTCNTHGKYICTTFACGPRLGKTIKANCKPGLWYSTKGDPYCRECFCLNGIMVLCYLSLCDAGVQTKVDAAYRIESPDDLPEFCSYGDFIHDQCTRCRCDNRMLWWCESKCDTKLSSNNKKGGLKGKFKGQKKLRGDGGGSGGGDGGDGDYNGGGGGGGWGEGWGGTDFNNKGGFGPNIGGGGGIPNFINELQDLFNNNGGNFGPNPNGAGSPYGFNNVNPTQNNYSNGGEFGQNYNGNGGFLNEGHQRYNNLPNAGDFGQNHNGNGGFSNDGQQPHNIYPHGGDFGQNHNGNGGFSNNGQQSHNNFPNGGDFGQNHNDNGGFTNDGQQPHNNFPDGGDFGQNHNNNGGFTNDGHQPHNNYPNGGDFEISHNGNGQENEQDYGHHKDRRGPYCVVGQYFTQGTFNTCQGCFCTARNQWKCYSIKGPCRVDAKKCTPGKLKKSPSRPCSVCYCGADSTHFCATDEHCSYSIKPTHCEATACQSVCAGSNANMGICHQDKCVCVH